MRNLHIEVRQLRGSSASRNTLDATGTVRLQPGHAGGQVHLEAQGTRPAATPTPPTDSRVVTTLVAPLNKWVTVAQSDEDGTSSSSGLFNHTPSAGRSTLTVQLRISLRQGPSFQPRNGSWMRPSAP